MDSNGVTSPRKDKWDADGDCQSLRSPKKDSPESLRRQEDANGGDSAEKNRSWHSDSEQDQLSDVDGRRSTPSFYSDEYDSPSEGSKSPYSQSRIASYSQRQMQAKTTSSTPVYKKGAPSEFWKISVICSNVQMMAVWSHKPHKQSCQITNSFWAKCESPKPTGSHILSFCFYRLRGACRCLSIGTSTEASSGPAASPGCPFTDQRVRTV